MTSSSARLPPSPPSTTLWNLGDHLGKHPSLVILVKFSLGIISPSPSPQLIPFPDLGSHFRQQLPMSIIPSAWVSSRYYHADFWPLKPCLIPASMPIVPCRSGGLCSATPGLRVSSVNAVCTTTQSRCIHPCTLWASSPAAQCRCLQPCIKQASAPLHTAGVIQNMTSGFRKQF